MNYGAIFRFSPVESFTPAPDRPAHWAPLDSVLRALIALFATPFLLWRQGFNSAALAQVFLARLREGERAARALLVRDALALSALAPRRRRSRKHRPAPAQLCTADFRGWRAALAFRAPTQRAAPPASLGSLFFPAADPGTPRAFTARGCALRYEALRRVIENPAPFALRLARRLRGAKSGRLVRVVARIANDRPPRRRALEPPDRNSG